MNMCCYHDNIYDAVLVVYSPCLFTRGLLGFSLATVSQSFCIDLLCITSARLARCGMPSTVSDGCFLEFGQRKWRGVRLSIDPSLNCILGSMGASMHSLFRLSNPFFSTMKMPLQNLSLYSTSFRYSKPRKYFKTDSSLIVRPVEKSCSFLILPSSLNLSEAVSLSKFPCSLIELMLHGPSREPRKSWQSPVETMETDSRVLERVSRILIKSKIATFRRLCSILFVHHIILLCERFEECLGTEMHIGVSAVVVSLHHTLTFFSFLAKSMTCSNPCLLLATNPESVQHYVENDL